jgi:hypothetical protein
MLWPLFALAAQVGCLGNRITTSGRPAFYWEPPSLTKGLTGASAFSKILPSEARS